MEVLVLLGTLFILFSVGALSALNEIHTQKKESKWAFQPPVYHVQQLEQPIDKASNFGMPEQLEQSIPNFNEGINPIIVHQEELTIMPESFMHAESSFEHSVVPAEVNENLNVLMQNFNSQLHVLQDEGNESKLSHAMKEKIRGLVGEKTARLVTNLVTDLNENKLSVIIGLINPADNTLVFEGNRIHLSSTKEILSGENDLVLVKGTLLPNGVFRVAHYDDAETVEAGYGVESFILPKIA
ncbi:TPA: hypothetical protein NJY08_005000 [Salmonella enterica subsp. enterica serovar Typhi str. AG3]|nr:hypothetical protein [Salmonella enterica subsp. enterica serovar Typhi str. AG3]